MWKFFTMTCATLVSFSQGIGPLALVIIPILIVMILLTSKQAPMFDDYIEAFDSNLADVVQFTDATILVLGFSNFIWYVSLSSVRCIYVLTFLKGAYPELLWPTTCSHFLYCDLLCIKYLESKGKYVWQFYGCLCVCI